jgi:hypothetical protein
MRQPNFKLGWFVPNQIAALTHEHPQITPEDFAGIVQAGQTLLGLIENDFHILIDNRFVAMTTPASLSQMKQAVSYMNHPCLRWVVVVKPLELALDTVTLPVEQDGQTRLKNVSSLSEAFNFLRDKVDDIHWLQADHAFFPK